MAFWLVMKTARLLQQNLILVDHGPYQESEWVVDRPALYILSIQYIPNLAGLSRLAHTNHNTVLHTRGYGSPASLHFR